MNIDADVLWQWLCKWGDLRFALDETKYCSYCILRESRHTRKYRWSFEDLFRKYGDLKCSVNHDKVYALMGLAAKEGEVKELLEVSYGLEEIWLLHHLLSIECFESPLALIRNAFRELHIDPPPPSFVHDEITIGLRQDTAFEPGGEHHELPDDSYPSLSYKWEIRQTSNGAGDITTTTAFQQKLVCNVGT